MRKHPFIFGGLLVFVAMLLIAAVNTGPNTGGSGGSATNAVATLKSNGVQIASGATSLNFIWGTNVVMDATNTAGAVDLRISAAGGSVGFSSLTWTNNGSFIYPSGTVVSNTAPIIIRRDGSIFEGTNTWQDVAMSNITTAYPLYYVSMVSSNEPNHFVLSLNAIDDEATLAFYSFATLTGTATKTTSENKLTLKSRQTNGASATWDLYTESTTNSYLGLTLGASTTVFKVDGAGDLVQIKNVAYKWPLSQGAAKSGLTNDGSGNLGWYVFPLSQPASATLTNLAATGALTNITSANQAFTSLLNASNQPVVKTVSAGANMTVTDNGTNLVLASSGGGGSGFAALEMQTNDVRVGLQTNVNHLVTANLKQFATNNTASNKFDLLLDTAQGIQTTSTPQFARMGVGVAADSGVGLSVIGGWISSNASTAMSLQYSNGFEILTSTNIAGAPTNTGISITNAVAATVGVQQYAPPIMQWGNGWKTTATAGSQPIGVQLDLEPVQGTTTPTANWTVRFATNGTAFGANAAMRVSSLGGVNVSDGTANNPAFGFISDDDGSGTGLYRSAANTVSIALNGSEAVRISSAVIATAVALGFGSAASSSDIVATRVGSGRILRWTGNSAAFTNSMVGNESSAVTYSSLDYGYDTAMSVFFLRSLTNFISGSKALQPIAIGVHTNADLTIHVDHNITTLGSFTNRSSIFAPTNTAAMTGSSPAAEFAGGAAAFNKWATNAAFRTMNYVVVSENGDATTAADVRVVVDEDVDGTWDIDMRIGAPAGLTSMQTNTFSFMMSPSARWAISNMTSGGSAAAALISVRRQAL